MTEIKNGQIWENVVQGDIVKIVEVKCADGGREYIWFRIMANPSIGYTVDEIISGWSPSQFRRDHRLVPWHTFKDYKTAEERKSVERQEEAQKRALREIRELAAKATLDNVKGIISKIRIIATCGLYGHS